MTIEDLLVSQGWVITYSKENFFICSKKYVKCEITYNLGKPQIYILSRINIHTSEEIFLQDPARVFLIEPNIV